MEYKDKVQKMYHRREFWGCYPKWGYIPTMDFYFSGPTFRYRYDPVPGVKHWKNSVVGCYRHPKTTQELRWYYAHKKEVNIRGKRTPKCLPTWYDDIPHARREKGWKRTKKKRQWM